MKKVFAVFGSILALALVLDSCNSKEDEVTFDPNNPNGGLGGNPNIPGTFGGEIDLNNLYNYENQIRPEYINKDNTPEVNPINNMEATLGRVLFYDTRLSSSNSISCGSCHQQRYAFTDALKVSEGVNGNSQRHSMRLVNMRYSSDSSFFWDQRATHLENQIMAPIEDHILMGYSGSNGDPTIDDLLEKLGKLGYYQELLYHTYGDIDITTERISNSLSQFIRSIQSFDAKYDLGRADALNDIEDFANFTEEENQGKALFLNLAQFNAQGVRTGGGFGCASCHRPPEYALIPDSKNNGVTAKIGGGEELNATRSPSLRDLFDPSGVLNSKLMHTGDYSFSDVLNHYDDVSINSNLDPRLAPNGFGQKLQMTELERANLLAFIKTLSGSNLYTDPKWSNPFQ